MKTTSDEWQMDCRPDLVEDSEMWHHLLMTAKAIERDHPESVYGALDGMRALGARLTWRDGKLQIERGVIPEAEYKELREQKMKPHHEQIIRLLNIMERWHK